MNYENVLVKVFDYVVHIIIKQVLIICLTYLQSHKVDFSRDIILSFIKGPGIIRNAKGRENQSYGLDFFLYNSRGNGRYTSSLAFSKQDKIVRVNTVPFPYCINYIKQILFLGEYGHFPGRTLTLRTPATSLEVNSIANIASLGKFCHLIVKAHMVPAIAVAHYYCRLP